MQNISDRDVMRKSLQAMKNVATTSGVPQYPCVVESEVAFDGKVAECKRSLEKEGGRTKSLGKNVLREVVSEWEEAIKAADGSDMQQIYPLILYLSSARLWNENRIGEIDKIPSRTDAYQRCLDQKRSNQSSFEYIRLLGNLASEENDGKPLPAYEVIMNAVRYSLQEELLPGQQVLYSSRYGGIAVKNADGTIIDLSLHPTWQRRIVRILKELFPKVQFICATHSPFIVQSLEDGELIVLDGELDEEYSGQSIEDISEDIMQVPIVQYSEKKLKMYEVAEKYFHALKKCISEEELGKLKEELDYWSSIYSDNPAYSALMKQKYLEKKMEMKE